MKQLLLLAFLLAPKNAIIMFYWIDSLALPSSAHADDLNTRAALFNILRWNESHQE